MVRKGRPRSRSLPRPAAAVPTRLARRAGTHTGHGGPRAPGRRTRPVTPPGFRLSSCRTAAPSSRSSTNTSPVTASGTWTSCRWATSSSAPGDPCGPDRWPNAGAGASTGAHPARPRRPAARSSPARGRGTGCRPTGRGRWRSRAGRAGARSRRRSRTPPAAVADPGVQAPDARTRGPDRCPLPCPPGRLSGTEGPPCVSHSGASASSRCPESPSPPWADSKPSCATGSSAFGYGTGGAPVRRWRSWRRTVDWCRMTTEGLMRHAKRGGRSSSSASTRTPFTLVRRPDGPGQSNSEGAWIPVGTEMDWVSRFPRPGPERGRSACATKSAGMGNDHDRTLVGRI